jgi:hypothetical protein
VETKPLRLRRHDTGEVFTLFVSPEDVHVLKSLRDENGIIPAQHVMPLVEQGRPDLADRWQLMERIAELEELLQTANAENSRLREELAKRPTCKFLGHRVRHCSEM